MAKLVAKTYGDALFEEAIEKDILDSITEEAEAVLELWEQNEELQKLMMHPQIMVEEKLDVLSKILEGRISRPLFGFLNVIVQKGRQGDLKDIFSYYISRVKEYKHIGVISVSAPMPLSEEQKKAVEQKVLSLTDYEKLETSYQEDESLIGGIVIRIGDRIIDGSVKSKINNMARELKRIQIV